MRKVWQGERKNKESVRGRKMGEREEGGREGGKEEREGSIGDEVRVRCRKFKDVTHMRHQSSTDVHQACNVGKRRAQLV